MKRDIEVTKKRVQELNEQIKKVWFKHDMIYHISEMDAFFKDEKPYDLLRSAFKGKFNTKHSFFCIDSYYNLVTMNNEETNEHIDKMYKKIAHKLVKPKMLTEKIDELNEKLKKEGRNKEVIHPFSDLDFVFYKQKTLDILRHGVTGLCTLSDDYFHFDPNYGYIVTISEEHIEMHVDKLLSELKTKSKTK